MSLSTGTEYISVGGNRHGAASDWSTTSGLVAYGADQNVALWKPLSDRGILQVLRGHKSVVTATKFFQSEDSDKRLLVSGSGVGEVRIWCARPDGDGYEQEAVSATEKAHEGSINVIAVQQGHPVFLTGGADCTVRLWRISEDGLIPSAAHRLKPRLIPLAINIAPCQSLHSTDELLFAVAGTRNDIQVYAATDLRSPEVKIQLQVTLSGHEGWVRSLSFTQIPDSNDLLLASASHDKYVRIWLFKNSAASGKESTKSEDDTVLEQSLTAKVHKVALAEETYSITFEALLLGHEDWVYSAAWSTTKATPQLLTASADGSLSIWEADPASGIWVSTHRLGEISGQKGATTATGSAGGFWTALWSPDDQAVTCLGRTGSWRVWKQDPSTQFWQQRTGISGHTAAANGLCWSSDGAYLLSTSSDQTTRLHAEWRREATRSWHEFARPQIHGYDLNCVVSTKPHQFVSGADEKLLRVFTEPKSIATLLERLCNIRLAESGALPETAAIPVLGLSNKSMDDGQTVDGANDDGTNRHHEMAPIPSVSLSDLQEPPTEDVLARHTLWPEQEKLYGHGYEISECASNADGSIIATACKASSVDYAVIRLYDTTTWEEIRPPLAAHNLTVTRLAFSPIPNQYLLSVSRDRQWAVFEQSKEGQKTWALLQCNTKAHTRMILDAAWYPSSEHTVFATAGRDKTIKIWSRVVDGESTSFALRQTLTRKSAVTALSITSTEQSDAMCIAAGEEDGSLSLHRVKLNDTGTYNVTSVDLPKHTFNSSAVNRIAWRPKNFKVRQEEDSAQLAVASADGLVRILRVRIGEVHHESNGT